MNVGSLNRHSFHFRQNIDGGYRYLDKCGEFLAVAEKEFDLIPDEANPQGGVMSHPELGIKVHISATEIQVIQEYPPNDAKDLNDGKDFLDICLQVSSLFFELFKPRSVHRNGFDAHLFYPFVSIKDSFKKSLTYCGEYEKMLAKMFDMVPNYKNLEYSLTSGSRELVFKIKNISLENISSSILPVPARASKKQIQKFSRREKEIEKFAKIDKPYGLLFVLDLMEVDPPIQDQTENLKDHFTELMEKEKIMKKEIIKK